MSLASVCRWRAWRTGRAWRARAGRLAALAACVAWAGLGCAQTGRGEAIAADIKAAREEQTPEKLLDRGKAYAGVRDYTRAEQYLSAALDAGAPPSSVLPVLLKVCIEENRFRAALLYAEPQLKARPDDIHLRFVVASLHAGIGQPNVALEHLAQIAKAKPDYAEVQYAMAVLLRDEEHDPVRADARFREYLRLEPQGRHAPEARASLLKNFADALDAATTRPPAPVPAPAQPAPEGAAPPTWKTVP